MSVNIFELPIVPNESLTRRQVLSKPKSKKKRIRKKWLKYPRKYHMVPRKEAIIFSDRIECHPDYIEHLKEGLEGLKGGGDNDENSLSGGFTHTKTSTGEEN